MNTTSQLKWIGATVLCGFLAIGLAGSATAQVCGYPFPDLAGNPGVDPADYLACKCPDRDTYIHFPRVPVGSSFCAEETGRMAALAGSDVRTLRRGTIEMEISVPGDQTVFELGIFDGDTGKDDSWPSGTGGTMHWDSQDVALEFKLYSDPDPLDPTQRVLYGTWLGNLENQPVSGTDPNWTASPAYLPDNDWWTLILTPIEDDRRDSDGNFHYYLEINYPPCASCPTPDTTISTFRLRGRASADNFQTTTPIAFATSEFGFEAAMHNLADVFTVYPLWDGVVPDPDVPNDVWLDFVANGQTTYDGKWSFLATLPQLLALELYDGDFDFGNDRFVGDLADPSRNQLPQCTVDPRDPLSPPTSDTFDLDSFAFPKGVGVLADWPFFVDFDGTPPMPVDSSLPQREVLIGGDPTDNSIFDLLRREPCVVYRVADPNGTIYENLNPSSQREWEQFRICSSNSQVLQPGMCDYTQPGSAMDILPAGTWSVEIEGMDMSNLNTWHLEVEEAVDACLIEVGKSVFPEQLPGVGGSHEVTYTYVVTNNADPLVAVDLVDDKLGVIASDITLAPGETRTFTMTTDIFVTTTNVVTADGVTGFGTMCADQDMATVTVVDDDCPPDLDFEFDPAGNALVPGQIIDDEFATMGITVTTNDPTNHPAMIFGSDNPTGGDWDLGTPNQTFGGPGIGSGGEAGQTGENADYLGNILILSEDLDQSDPDDNAGGGTFIFTFATPVRLDAVDILDIDESTVGTVVAYDATGAVVGAGVSSILGDNSYQKVFIGALDVSRLEVYFPGSGALGTIYFCIEDSVCLPTIDFDQDAVGNDLPAGHIIDDEFAAYGVQVSTNDPVNHPLMIFDSQNPTGGDVDLGTANQTFGGPGIGAGGEAGQPGENALSRGKVLIISEDADSSDPDDNGQGGLIAFDFAQPVELWSVGILDIDGSESMGTVTAFDELGNVLAFADMLPLGDNSYQSVSVPATEVRRLEVMFPRSGAVTEVVFCVEDGPCTPKTVRDDFEHQSWGNNDGPDDWAADWVENDVAGAGPTSGNVRIWGGYLKLEDYPNTGTIPSAARTVDLSGDLASATLSFDFRTTSGVDTSDSVKLEISDDGGASWTLLEEFTGIHGSSSGSRSINITSFASAETTIRFKVANKYGGSDEYFKVAYVEITSECESDCPAGSVRDEFRNDDFSGNDGPDNWVGSWMEDDPLSGGAGPSSGNVRVYGQRLKLDDRPNTGGYPSAKRTVDLSGADQATLTFTYMTTSGVDTSDKAVVEVSSDGGATWTVLHTYTNIRGSSSGTGTFDISGFISAQTMVRFRIKRLYGGRHEYFKVDNVEVSYSSSTCVP